MSYPIPEPLRLPLSLLLFALGAVVFKIMMAGGLEGPTTRWGIVDLELAGTVERVTRILESWDARGVRRFAVYSLRLDFPFIVIYSTALGTACAITTDLLQAKAWPLASIGLSLAWLQWFAGLLDAIENVALLNVLNGPVEQPWPRLAQVCALLKFALILLGLLYMVYGWAAWAV